MDDRRGNRERHSSIRSGHLDLSMTVMAKSPSPLRQEPEHGRDRLALIQQRSV
jgi:hypothetical protein